MEKMEKGMYVVFVVCHLRDVALNASCLEMTVHSVSHIYSLVTLMFIYEYNCSHNISHSMGRVYTCISYALSP